MIKADCTKFDFVHVLIITRVERKESRFFSEEHTHILRTVLIDCGFGLRGRKMYAPETFGKPETIIIKRIDEQLHLL